MFRCIFVIYFFIFCNFDVSIFAKEEDVLINEINKEFKKIKTLQAKFSEHYFSEKGVYTANGEIFMQKPYKIRVNYIIPREISITMQGKENAIYYDYKMNEVTYFKISNMSVLKFISSDNIDLKNDNIIKSVKKECDFIKLVLDGKKININSTLKDEEMIDVFILFQKKFTSNYLIKKIGTIDKDDKIINEIIFENISINNTIDPNIFVFKDPSFYE